MSRDNLPYLLTMVSVEYFVVLLLCLYCKEKYSTKVNEDDNKSKFKSTYHCILPDNYAMQIILLLHRIFWLAFFSVCVAFIYIEYLRDDASNYQYFTFWNVFIILIYYTLTTCSSLIGLFSCYTGVNDYYRFGVIVNVFFEVVGSTAIWITVINFTFLNSSLTYINMAPHLFTSISLFTEIIFSAMTVDATHLIYLLTWVLLYIIVIMVLYPATGELNDWPYWFLDTSSPYCYFWYTAMFIALTVSYFVWWSLSAVKCRYLLSSNNTIEEEKEELTQQLLDSQSESQPSTNITISTVPLPAHDPASFDSSWAEAANSGGFGWWKNAALSEYYSSSNMSTRDTDIS